MIYGQRSERFGRNFTDGKTTIVKAENVLIETQLSPEEMQKLNRGETVWSGLKSDDDFGTEIQFNIIPPRTEKEKKEAGLRVEAGHEHVQD